MGNFKYQLIFAGIITALFGLFGYSKAATVIGQPKFTGNSTFTASHIYSILPAGGHPAAGSNKQVMVNVKGSFAGAAQLNYSGANVGVGTTNPVAKLSVTATSGAAARGIVNSQHNNGAQAAVMNFRKSRGSEASPSAMTNGDYIGAFGFSAYDGSSYLFPAFFGARVNGTVSAGSTPTELFFCNSAAGVSNCFTENKVRMLIDTGGKVGVNTTAPTSQLHVVGLPVYGGATLAAANTAAAAAGHTSGAFFLWSTAGARAVGVVR